MEDDDNLDETFAMALKGEVSQFALPTPSPTPSPLRRSARRRTTVTVAASSSSSQNSSPSSINSPTKKRKSEEVSRELTAVKKRKIKTNKNVNKGYAPPEMYAHLKGLTDRLDYDLDGACKYFMESLKPD